VRHGRRVSFYFFFYIFFLISSKRLHTFCTAHVDPLDQGICGTVERPPTQTKQSPPKKFKKRRFTNFWLLDRRCIFLSQSKPPNYKQPVAYKWVSIFWL